MNKLLLLPALFFAAFALFVACSRNMETVPANLASAGIKTLFDNQIKNHIQTFTLNAAAGGAIVGKEGTRITFPANSFYRGGVPVTGNVQVELVELYDRTSMLLTNKTTIARNQDGLYEPLVSAGEFGLRASQNGTDIGIQANLAFQSRPSNTFDPAMDIYQAQDSIPITDTLGTNLGTVWQQVADTVNHCSQYNQIGTYCFNFWAINRTGWIWCNIDSSPFFTSYTQPTKLNVQLPAQYDYNKARVFVIINGVNAVYQAPWNSNIQSFQSLALYAKNAHIQIISVLDDNGTLKYAIQPHYLTANTTLTLNNFQPTTEASLKTILDALP